MNVEPSGVILVDVCHVQTESCIRGFSFLKKN
jgi:hypothetical protein